MFHSFKSYRAKNVILESFSDLFKEWKFGVKYFYCKSRITTKKLIISFNFRAIVVKSLGNCATTNNENSTQNDENLIICSNGKISILAKNGIFSKKKLYLKNCSIEQISPGTFDGLRELESMALSNNLISSINESTFKNLLKLKHLHLDRNNLRLIEKGLLKNLWALKSFFCSKNQITFVSEEAFEDNINLETISLGNNLITDLNVKTFQRLSELLRVDLKRNLLTVINAEIFKDNTKLTFVDLSHNRIANLRAGTFKELNYLNVLELENNTCIDKSFRPASNENVIYKQIGDAAMHENPFNRTIYYKVQLNESDFVKCTLLDDLEVKDDSFNVFLVIIYFSVDVTFALICFCSNYWYYCRW